jgi:predicted Rossmann fold nucleotide-binding protein DprA/Smf involved in DNA uptake
VPDASLAALLLTNRIVDVGTKPLSAGELWSLCAAVDDLSVLVGMSPADIAEHTSLPLGDAERCAALLAAGTAFAFERERLEEEGLRLISALDEAFPQRVRQRLAHACPAFLLVGGPAAALGIRGVGVVGSRDASAAALEVAASAARVVAATGLAVVGGLARGVDTAAMDAAISAGGPVVGVPADGIRIAARSPEIRRRVLAGDLCIASPYRPDLRFSAGSAMGRNKIVYALADVTLVVSAESDSGGTWEGAREALQRNFGRVAVWTGEGAGPRNAELIQLGAVAITDVADLPDVPPVEPTPAPVQHPSLFD